MRLGAGGPCKAPSRQARHACCNCATLPVAGIILRVSHRSVLGGHPVASTAMPVKRRRCVPPSERPGILPRRAHVKVDRSTVGFEQTSDMPPVAVANAVDRRHGGAWGVAHQNRGAGSLGLTHAPEGSEVLAPQRAPGLTNHALPHAIVNKTARDAALVLRS
jgi:hypothetical protein